ncbi:MAG: serine/threonine-protein phosphatase [Arcobacteraceae bacterium]|nr:serine/threonine-protein phosphatase [Arcobacteraceae bacterium]MDY0327718.1 serine/threonine-protein phosphatase [Arcobacteraceae bacterium]
MYSSYYITHPGKTRLNNEDSYFINDIDGLWIVCDGMGGHQEGNFASRLVTDIFEYMKFSDNFEENLESIVSQIYNIHMLLKKKAQKTGKNSVVGTTIVLLHIIGSKGLIIHAGDSRCYHLRNNELTILTQDHAKNITTENGTRKVLINALSAPGELSIEINKIDVKKNDIFFLCSDGIYETLSINFIKNSLEEINLQNGLDRITEKILSGSATDNLTAIIVKI